MCFSGNTQKLRILKNRQGNLQEPTEGLPYQPKQRLQNETKQFNRKFFIDKTQITAYNISAEDSLCDETSDGSDSSVK